jgi:hypothetical protein
MTELNSFNHVKNQLFPLFAGRGEPMNTPLMHGSKRPAYALPIIITFAALALTTLPFHAQNPELQQKLGEIKEASAANKAALAHYTWQEQQTTSIKGDVKKQQMFQISVGPDGQQQKTEIGGSQAAPPSGGRLKQHVVEKKTAEFKDYGEQIADLAKQYTQPDPGRLQAAFQAGNVSLQSGGGEGEVTLVIKNYVKPNDSVTLVFNKQQKAIQSIQVSSYLDSPTDGVNIAAQFAKLPDGTNHVAGTQINGVSKQLTVVTQNSNYQPA